MDRRTDYKTALLIEAMIHTHQAERAVTARALADIGVPFEVSLRILTKPNERRQEMVLPNSLRYS
jgi:16S rRNA G527 N7-methylase RsmG